LAIIFEDTESALTTKRALSGPPAVPVEPKQIQHRDNVSQKMLLNFFMSRFLSCCQPILTPEDSLANLETLSTVAELTLGFFQ